MEELISIIIPIYRVEKYLKECIDSVINQTYKNLEVILVNDGSPDNCGNMCDEYARKDKRVKVIHKKNGGLSDARNHGIDMATGKYITFIDSDDYVDLKYIEKLYDSIKKNNTKISQCNILKVNDKKEIIEKVGYSENNVKSGKELIKDIYYEHWAENIVVWNKMYSIELFEKIKYPVGKIHEDEYVTYKILYYIDKVSIVNEYLYCYRQNDNSITGKKFNIQRLDVLEAFEERLTFFEEKNEKELYELTLKAYLEKLVRCYMQMKKYIEETKSMEIELIKKYRKNYIKILKSKKMTTFSKIKMFCFYSLPNIYYNLKKSNY